MRTLQELATDISVAYGTGDKEYTEMVSNMKPEEGQLLSRAVFKQTHSGLKRKKDSKIPLEGIKGKVVPRNRKKASDLLAETVEIFIKTHPYLETEAKLFASLFGGTGVLNIHKGEIPAGTYQTLVRLIASDPKFGTKFVTSLGSRDGVIQLIIDDEKESFVNNGGKILFSPKGDNIKDIKKEAGKVVKESHIGADKIEVLDSLFQQFKVEAGNLPWWAKTLRYGINTSKAQYERAKAYYCVAAGFFKADWKMSAVNLYVNTRSWAAENRYGAGEKAKGIKGHAKKIVATVVHVVIKTGEWAARLVKRAVVGAMNAAAWVINFLTPESKLIIADQVAELT